MTKKKENYGKVPHVEVENTTKTEQYETIFTLVERKEGVKIAVADKLISKLNFTNLEEAKQYIDSKPWELIVNATCLLYDLTKNVKNNK